MSVKNVCTLLDKMFYSFSSHNLSSHLHQNAEVVKMASCTRVNPIRGVKRNINTFKPYKAIPVRRFRKSHRHYFELKEAEIEPDSINSKAIGKSYKYTEKSSPLYRSLYSYKKPHKNKYVDKRNKNHMKYFTDENEVEQFTRRVTAFRTNRRSKDQVTWPPLYRYKGVLDRKQTKPPPNESPSFKKIYLKVAKKHYPTEVLQPLYSTKARPVKKSLPKFVLKIKEPETKHEENPEEVEKITEKVGEEEINALKMKIQLHKQANKLDTINRVKYQLGKIVNEKSSIVQQYLKKELEKELSFLKTTSPIKYAALINEGLNKPDNSTQNKKNEEVKDQKFEILPPVEMHRNDRMSIVPGLKLARNKMFQKSNEAKNFLAGTVPCRSFLMTNSLSSDSKKPESNALIDKRRNDLLEEIDAKLLIHKLRAAGLTPRSVMKYVEEKNENFKKIKSNLIKNDKKEPQSVVTGMTKFFLRPRMNNSSVTSFSAYKERQRLNSSKGRKTKSKLKLNKEKKGKPVLLTEARVTKEHPAAVKNEDIESLPPIEDGEKTKLLESPTPLFTPPNRMFSTSSSRYNRADRDDKSAYQPLYAYKNDKKDDGINRTYGRKLSVEGFNKAYDELPANESKIKNRSAYLDVSFPQKVEPLTKGQRNVISLRKLIQEKMGRLPPVGSKSTSSVPIAAVQNVKSETLRETSSPNIGESIDAFQRMTSPSRFDKADVKIKLNLPVNKKQESVEKFQELPMEIDRKTIVKNVFHADIPLNVKKEKPMDSWKNEIRKSVFTNEQEIKSPSRLKKSENNVPIERNPQKLDTKVNANEMCQKSDTKAIIQDVPQIGQSELCISKNCDSKAIIQEGPKTTENELLYKSTKSPTCDLIATSKKLDALQTPEKDPNFRNKMEFLSKNVIANKSISYPNESKRAKKEAPKTLDIKEIEEKLLQEIKLEVKKACERSLKEIKTEMSKNLSRHTNEEKDKINKCDQTKSLINLNDSKNTAKKSKSLDECVNSLFEELYDISKKEVEHLSNRSLDRLSHKRYLNKFDDIMNKITQKICRVKKESENEQKCESAPKNKNSFDFKNPNVIDCRKNNDNENTIKDIKKDKLKPKSNMKLKILSSNGEVTALDLSKNSMVHATISLPSLNARPSNVKIVKKKCPEDEFKSKELNNKVQCDEITFNKTQCAPTLEIFTHKMNDQDKNKDTRGVFDISVLSNSLDVECPVQNKTHTKPKVENEVCKTVKNDAKHDEAKSKCDVMKSVAFIASVPQVANLLSDEKEKFEDNFLASKSNEKSDGRKCTKLVPTPIKVCTKAADVLSNQKKEASTCTQDSEEKDFPKHPLRELLNASQKKEPPPDTRRNPLAKLKKESDKTLNSANMTDKQPECLSSAPCDELQSVPPDNIHPLKIEKKNNMTSPSKVDVCDISSKLFHVQQPVLRCFIIPDVSELQSNQCCPTCPQEYCCDGQCCLCPDDVKCCDNVQSCSENVDNILLIKNQVLNMQKKYKDKTDEEKCDMPLDPSPVPIAIENYQEPVFDHKSIRIKHETQECPKGLKLPYIPIDYEKTWYTDPSVKTSLKHDSKGQYYYKISGMLFPK